MQHDTAYTYGNPERQSIADKTLLRDSKNRIVAADASFGERAAAVGVVTVMSIKSIVDCISSIF